MYFLIKNIIIIISIFFLNKNKYEEDIFLRIWTREGKKSPPSWIQFQIFAVRFCKVRAVAISVGLYFQQQSAPAWAVP